MKKFICSLLLVMVSTFTQVESTLTFTKKEMIDQANNHLKEAKANLLYVKDTCAYIPDLGDKKHMEALLEGAVASMGVENPKGKIVTIGLSLIGSLVNNMYDKYLFARTKLCLAAHHFEMANYYNRFSLYVPGHKWMDSGTQQFFKAIDNITVCVMLSTCVEDECDRDMLLGYFIELRDDLIKQFMDSGNKLTISIYNDALHFYENVSEVAAEIDDEILRQDLCIYTGAAVECIACSLRQLENLDCWPDLDEWKHLMWAMSPK